jgi:glutamine amidotransferase
MGRVAAYLGPSTRIAAIVEQGTQSLARQSTEYADGFCLGWFPGDGGSDPLAYVSDRPLWRNEQLLDIARRYDSSSMIAAVKRAQPGENNVPAAQIFRHGPFLFHHQGELVRQREVFDRPLLSRLGERTYRQLKGTSASELLFATWAEAIGDEKGPEAAANALEKLVGSVRDIAEAGHAPATLAIVVADGKSLVTLRTAIGGTPPSLYTIVADDGAPLPKTARIIATEPLFKGSWSALEPHSLVIFTID